MALATERVVSANRQLAVQLDPAPIEAPSLADRFTESFGRWAELASARQRGHDLEWLPAWAQRNLAGLAELEAGWASAATGDALCHCDLRADNLLLTEHEVVVVDWPWASIGAAWFDGVAMVPSLIMQGAPDWQPLLERYFDALEAPPDGVSAVLAALAGFFLYWAHQPAEPGLPTLPAFQRAQGEAAIDWLRIRTGWH